MKKQKQTLRALFNPLIFGLLAIGVLSCSQSNTNEEKTNEATTEFKGKIALDIRDSESDWSAYLPKQAPKDAPNILFVLYDDTGLGAWSPYGGAINMPTMDKLAENGLTYTTWFEVKGNALHGTRETILPNGDKFTATMTFTSHKDRIAIKNLDRRDAEGNRVPFLFPEYGEFLRAPKGSTVCDKRRAAPAVPAGGSTRSPQVFMGQVEDALTVGV